METALVKIENSDDFAIVDAEDFEKVSAFKWSRSHSETTDFIYRYISGNKIQMLSRFILGIEDVKKHYRIYHINKNKLDFRKSNLRHKKSCDINAHLYVWRDKSRRRPWVLEIRHPLLSRNLKIGCYSTELIVNSVIAYIKENRFPISTIEEVNSLLCIVKKWSYEQGFFNKYIPPPRQSKYKIGAEMTINNHVFIKTESGWEAKHRVLWKKAGNDLCNDEILLFKDGNRLNFDIENLEPVSQKENAIRINLAKYPEELHASISLFWQLKREIKEIEKPYKIKKTRPRILPNSYSLSVYFTKQKRTNKSYLSYWRVLIRCPSISKSQICIGCYQSQQIGNEAIEFIKKSYVFLSDLNDIAEIKRAVKVWAINQGYHKPLKTMSKNNSIQTKSIRK